MAGRIAFDRTVAACLGATLGLFGGAAIESTTHPPKPKESIFSQVDCDQSTSSATYSNGKEGVTTYQCIDRPGR